MILPNSYETILDKIKQDMFLSGWAAATNHEAWKKQYGIKDVGIIICSCGASWDSGYSPGPLKCGEEEHEWSVYEGKRSG